MAKGKRFYKKNPNAPEGQGAPEQNAAAGGENVNKKYENKSNGGQGGKPGQGTAGKPGGKPPRKFRKNNWDGNKDRNAGGKGANREGNAERGNRPEGKGDTPANRGGNRPGNRPFRARFENRKPQMAGRLLVAYYSWSGVTEKAAQKIASVAKGNTYRILPVKAYPSMYGLCVAKAGMEKASGARPELLPQHYSFVPGKSEPGREEGVSLLHQQDQRPQEQRGRYPRHRPQGGCKGLPGCQQAG